MSKFQVIVIACFIFFIILGVALFATFKQSSSTSTALPAITVWGTFPADSVNGLVTQLNMTRTTPLTVNYVQETDATFDKDFINALADGTAPDAILIPQAILSRYSNKITQIPNTVLTQRDFENTYVGEADLYLTSQGTLAIPFSIDPLVMYWNRDLFTNAGIATYPGYWQDFNTVISRIDLKDVNSNIRRSAIALGEFANIDNAREILSLLLLQSGNPITTQTADGIVSTIGSEGQYQGLQTSVPAVNFFTQFANPQSSYYSWNRSLPDSKSWFLSGNLATYFGFASELNDIKAKNPNLNFDVAPIPQAENGTNRVTYGNMYGFSIVRTAQNQSGVYGVIQALTTPEALSYLSKETYLPPVRRDMIALGSTDPYQAIFFDSALISRGWLDTDTSASTQIFQTMVESITSGAADPSTALNTADGQLDLSLQTQ